MRLTAKNRERLLGMNEGFSYTTNFDSRNSSVTTTYAIRDGRLMIREKGKGSWSDSCFDRVYEADDGQTHRFLYRYKDLLNTWE